ncbi:hypothetical protein HX021_16410 [Sphingobacterium sp. N143]|nr:hypothetical protein [Sphingobacterium sp. N143]MDM1295874.1 hypothetical protein [Sphingobacterium sp. N143]
MYSYLLRIARGSDRDWSRSRAAMDQAFTDQGLADTCSESGYRLPALRN